MAAISVSIYFGCALADLSFFAGCDARGLTVTTLPLLLQGWSDQTTRPSTSQRNTGVCAEDEAGSTRDNARGKKSRADFFMKNLSEKCEAYYTPQFFPSFYICMTDT